MKNPMYTLYGGLKCACRFFFFFFIHSLTKRKPAILKCARRFFHSYLIETKKKSTVNSYNLISNHFHAKLMGKQLRNEAKFKLKNKLTNGHG